MPAILFKMKIKLFSLLLIGNYVSGYYTENNVCNVAPEERSNCGYGGIGEARCLQRGCCYENSIPGAIWCFKKGDEWNQMHTNTDITGSNGQPLKDCSYKFKNRIASFEYLYYHAGNSRINQYVYPDGDSVAITGTDIDSIKTDSLYQWHLREASTERANGKVDIALYMESMERPDHFLSATGNSIGLVYRNYKDHHECSSTKLGAKINIFCPDSCNPLRTEEDAEYYESCQIQVMASAPEYGSQCAHVPKLLYSSHKGWLYGYGKVIYSGQGESYILKQAAKSAEGWFDFKIITPKTAAYWTKIHQQENCHSSESIAASTTIKQSISKTSSETNSKTIDMKVGASKALKLLGLTAEFQTSFSWEGTNIDDMAKSTEHNIGGAGGATYKIKPGYKWIVYQWVGEAAYFKLSTVRVKTCDVPCGDVADENIDAYCHTDGEVEREKKFLFKADCNGTKVESIPKYEALKRELTNIIKYYNTYYNNTIQLQILCDD